MVKRCFLTVMGWFMAIALIIPSIIYCDTIEVEAEAGKVIYRGLFEKESTVSAGEIFLRIEHNAPKEDAAGQEGPGRLAYAKYYYFVAKSGHGRFEIMVSDSRTNIFPKPININFSENRIYKLKGTDIRFKMIKLIDDSITYQLLVPLNLKDKIKNEDSAASGSK